MSLPKSARVIVIGGGVIGSSVAYNLAKRGVKEIVLLERNKLTSGTTWHAAGLVGQLRASKIETLLSAEALQVYSNLEAETGLSTGFKQCGSLTIAATPERFEIIKRNAARARSYGLEAEVVTPEECGKIMSHDGVDLIRTDDVTGGLWLPGDGSGSPTDLTMSMAKGARLLGVNIFEGTGVRKILKTQETTTSQPRIIGIETDSGETIECEKIVLCTGQWSRQNGRDAGVNVPLHSCEHFYVTTNTMPGVHPNLPVCRDNDSFTYIREWGTGLLVGGFEPKSKPIWTEGVPENFEFGLLPDDYDHFMQLWEGAMHRFPSLEEAEINTFLNGPESFTTDNQYILGEAPECRNFYVAAGFNSAGIANAAGAGILISEWIVEGEPTRDVWGVDIRRFGDFHKSPAFLRDRVQEVLGLHYAMPWPRKELQSARGLRKTPLYDDLKDKGAVFGQKFGWERANYFVSDQEERKKVETSYTVDTPPQWLSYVRDEHVHTRTKVSLFDVSSFAKLEVRGRDALDAMQKLCCADVSTLNKAVYVACGLLFLSLSLSLLPSTFHAVLTFLHRRYTGMLNERGGYETDVTVTRLDESRYLVISPTAQATRDADWIRRNIEKWDMNNSVQVSDVSNSMCVLALMGPRSRDLLSSITLESLDEESVPFGSVRDVSIGHVAARVCRMTYVGELGYEIYVPVESAKNLYVFEEIEERIEFAFLSIPTSSSLSLSLSLSSFAQSPLLNTHLLFLTLHKVRYPARSW